MTERNHDSQKGAIIMEASICLPVFMFFIITLLSITQIAYTQAVVSVSLDRTAKQLAEYGRIYHAFGLDTALPGDGGKSSQIADELADFLENIGSYFGSDTLNDMGEALHGDSIVAYLLHFAGTETAEYLFRGNILGKSNATKEQFDKFKRANRIVGNFSWNQAKILEGGSDVFLIVDYEIEVIRFFSLDYSFSMRHCSYAKAWFGT